MTIHDQWYEQQHKKEFPTLKEIVKRISKGVFWVVSVRFDKDSGGLYRLIVFLRERE